MIAPIDLKVDGLDRMAAAWAQEPQIVQRELLAATMESGLLLQREVQELTPVGATGLTRQSIGAREPEVLADRVIGVVGSSLAHIVPVEVGSRPHMSPIQPLADWARAKLGISQDEARSVAWAIATKIKREGTKGAHMFRRAFDANLEQVRRNYVAAGQRIVAGLAGGPAAGGA